MDRQTFFHMAHNFGHQFLARQFVPIEQNRPVLVL